MSIDEKVDDALESIRRIEKNQQLTVEALKLIMEELGIRKKLVDIVERLEARNGSHPPPDMGADSG